MPRLLRTIAIWSGLLIVFSSPAAAQSSPAIGVRAAGMGGAFTAVADDGTAPYWNPAGQASGGFVGLTIDLNSLDRQSGAYLGIATPPLGVAYYRTATSTAGTDSGRNGSGERVIVDHAGASVVQSLGDSGLAVGAMLGAVHGNGATAFSADAGVMLSGALGRIGVSAHNLTAPSLGGMRLDRRVRAGVAVNAREDLVIAVDADLTKTVTPLGDWREAAAGMEAHPQAKVWVRGGAHWNTAGGMAAPIGSVGTGVSVRGSLRADAQVSFGSKDGDRGWGVGLSFVY